MTKEELHAQYGPKLVCTLPGPKAQAAVAADTRLISPSYTRSYPLVAKRGRGIRVEDVDGNEFLDFAAGIAVISTGHCHPEVVAAIQKQAAELIHISGTDFYHEALPIWPTGFPPLRRCRVRTNFSTATPALRRSSAHSSWPATIRGGRQVIAFFGAFHGRTMGALSLTGSKPQQKRRFSPLVPGVTHIRFPYTYRGCSGGPQEEEAFSMGCARYIEEKLFKTILRRKRLRPSSSSRFRVKAATWLRRITLCASCAPSATVTEFCWWRMKCNAGAGRTGKWWAIEHSGIEPDMVCMAKGIASGMPLGICMTRAEIMDWVPGSHASTFGGNPISIAAALATMDIIEREAWTTRRAWASSCSSGCADGKTLIRWWAMCAGAG